jgi:transcription-repair coupling factor (superfamily II helicase)
VNQEFFSLFPQFFSPPPTILFVPETRKSGQSGENAFRFSLSMAAPNRQTTKDLPKQATGARPAPFVRETTRKILVTGVTEPALPAVAMEFLSARPEVPAILVCRDRRSGEQMIEDLDFFSSLSASPLPLEIILLPEEGLTSDDSRTDFETAIDRLSALSRLQHYQQEKKHSATLVVVTTPLALLQETPSAQDLRQNQLILRSGQTHRFNELIETIRSFNYDSEVVCEAPGEYAVRGGIIDIYPVTASAPCRLDFFGDELEEIRVFDPATQRSGESLEELILTASPAAGSFRAREGIAEHLGTQVNWLLLEPTRLEELVASFWNENGEGALLHSLDSLQRIREKSDDTWLGLADLDLETSLFGPESVRLAYSSEPLSNYRIFPEAEQVGEDRLFSEQQARRDFLRQLHRWQKENYLVCLVTNNEGEEERLREILADEEGLREFRPDFRQGHLHEGFRLLFAEGAAQLSWPDAEGRAGLVVASDSEIFGRYRHRRSTRRRRATVSRTQVDQMLDFTELAEGDHLVHLQHGVCIFRGIGKIESRGQIREMISIEFADAVVLHVPLHESHLLSRYVGLTKARPALGRIGSKNWEKTRRAAERGILDMAAELLALQARREAREGYAFAPDNHWQREFENSFLFQETPDQLRVITETKQDMELPQPMDRLLCGDVGFGKTEVAIRAAFKAVMSGKQAAILVPTTVLAQQHFRTFRERMADYPVVVEMLSRFRTPSQRTEILKGIKSGRIDIVVGTHSILSKDIAFADLGLVVVDEEHRFGVRQKEQLKKMRESVDILSMSATPIPRTLYMALTGARDLSVIETAPVNRLPVKTIVKNYDDKLVTDAIRYEVRRGGQVFYLHNRVGSIEAVANRLQELVPEARIVVGHGQMGEHQLERIMTEFVDGRYDVLVCTTIIESGIDIPNCNTIIIEAADRFGLSQLYQIRGRVGRFTHQAYAYLLLQRHGRVLDLARKRLAALRQNTQLGAGFRIAMRDLELRGAGNLLGAAQSGHIAGVGFELYCQLLRQSIGRLKGEEQAVTVRATLKFDFVFFGEGASESEPGTRYEDAYTVLKRRDLENTACPPIQARIPDSYIQETRLRLDFYRQLALADREKQIDEIEASLLDRFGPLPEPVVALLLATRIRCVAEQKKILSVETEGNLLKCLRASGTRDDFIKVGQRFPRLTRSKPLLRLKEIKTFIQGA